MKKAAILPIIAILLSSCSMTDKKELLKYTLTTENYSSFLRVEHSDSLSRTNVSPFFKKHISFEDVELNFRNNYNSSKPYNYTVRADINGNGSEKNSNTRIYFSSDNTYELLSVSGSASFKDDYVTFEKLEKTNRGITHKESVSNTLVITGNTSYRLRFKVDSNFTESAETDAFFLIEKANVTFTATVNNSRKSYEFEIYPNFYGVYEIDSEVTYSDISDVSFKYTNAYYLAY